MVIRSNSRRRAAGQRAQKLGDMSRTAGEVADRGRQLSRHRNIGSRHVQIPGKDLLTERLQPRARVDAQVLRQVLPELVVGPDRVHACRPVRAGAVM